jgi:hypothetical protein
MAGKSLCAAVIVFHEVADGERWAKARKKGTPGNRHDLFASLCHVVAQNG